MFKNREAAGLLLLQKLKKYRGQNPLVLGIPRGAMPLAKIIADGLEGELNAILVHKISAPQQDEFAIGSVGLSGEIYRMPYIKSLKIPESYVQRAAAEQLEILKLRKRRFHLPDLNCKGRIVILVDDGIATGATVLGALHEIRAQRPKKIILAVGVISAHAVSQVSSFVEEFVALEEPEFFYAVSQFYEDFNQVSDEEVERIFKGREGNVLST